MSNPLIKENLTSSSKNLNNSLNSTKKLFEKKLFIGVNGGLSKRNQNQMNENSKNNSKSNSKVIENTTSNSNSILNKDDKIKNEFIKKYLVDQSDDKKFLTTLNFSDFNKHYWKKTRILNKDNKNEKEQK